MASGFGLLVGCHPHTSAIGSPLESSIKLPGVLNEIADVVGIDAAMKIATTFGGTDAYIPAKPTDNHWLVALLGRPTAIALCNHFATWSGQGCGIRISIPLGPASYLASRTALIRSLIREGKSVREIARIAQISQRAVYRQKKIMREEK